MAEATARIWVGIRPRPLAPGALSGFEFDSTRNTLSAVGEGSTTAYSFDRVFDCSTSSREVYEASTQKVVEGVLAGINGTVFAYGQTGSGKTFTMSALTRMAIVEIFEKIQADVTNTYKLRVSIIELYCERVQDLLRDDKSPLEVREDPVRGWIVNQVTEEPIENVEQFEALVKSGEARRATSKTSMNEHSSRSHLIVSVWVECTQFGEVGEDPNSRLACLNLVDLAGSECQKTAQTTGQRQAEGKDINLSLMALSQMLRDCAENSGVKGVHRNSILTKLLRSAIGGNSWTSMLGCIAPNVEHRTQSTQTLEFASRAKMVCNKVTINALEDPLTAMTREIMRLRRDLEGMRIQNASLTARVRRNETVSKGAVGCRPTPSKQTPRGTPMRHSYGGTPYGAWSAAKFMASVKPDLTARKLNLFQNRIHIGVEEDDENDENMVPATPMPVKQAIPRFPRLEDSPPQLCNMVKESTLLEAQARIAELVKENQTLKSSVTSVQLAEVQNRLSEFQRDNAALRAQVESASQRELALITDKQALAASLAALEVTHQQAQEGCLKLERELEEAKSQHAAAVAAAAVAAVQAAAHVIQKESEAKQPYRDREREMAMEWRQERMKMKEKHLHEILQLKGEIAAAAKQAKERDKLHKAAIAEMAAKERELLVSMEAARKALQSQADDKVALTSVRRRAPRSTLTDITNTVVKRKELCPSTVAKGLSFVSTIKKPKPVRMEYKIDKKPCKRLKMEDEPAISDIREFLIKEAKKRDAAVKTRKLATLMNEVEKNLWKNHKFGTEFSKDLMPKDELDHIVESILWVKLVEEEGKDVRVIIRCRFKEWWNGEYIGHMPDEERDAYVATLERDLGADVWLEELEAPDLLQFFLKNIVTQRQFLVAQETGVKDAQRREAAEAKKKPKSGVAKAQAELEREMRVVDSPIF